MRVCLFRPVLSIPRTLCVMVLACWAPVAGGAVIAYDGFEGYTAESNLNGGSLGFGWAGNWASEGAHTTVQSTTLVDPNGNVTAGSQAARLQPTTGLSDVANFMSRSFEATSSTLYVGFLIRNVSGVDSGDFYNFQVSGGATGNTTAALGVGIRNATNNPFFARVGSSSSGQTTNASINATQGVDFLLVAKFSKDGASTTFNRTDLFINPAGLTEPGTADATAISGVAGLDSLNLFSLRNFQPEEGDTVFIDELRIATTFDDALVGVPEPSQLLLFLAGGLGLSWRRRR